MSDLISRKAAIEAMEQRYCDIERVKKRPVTKGEQAIFWDMRGVVRSLPSWRCRMSDLISRQDAVCILKKKMIDRPLDSDRWVIRDIAVEIKLLPSAEPKTGEWVWSDEDASWMCSACCCAFEEIDWKPNYNFCPNCGVRMTPYKGGEDE